MLTDWPAVLLAILLPLAAGAGIGWSLCQQRAARELARLRALVPSPGLLRSLAYCADGVVPVYAEAARDLAARIEAAGAGAESVAAAWDQTPTWRE